MDRIEDVIDLEELEELHAERDQCQRLEEKLKDREQTLQRWEVLQQMQQRNPDLERRIELFASKLQSI